MGERILKMWYTKLMSQVQDEVFRLFHRHRRLVRRGLANPLPCNCGGSLYTALDGEDLILRCSLCGDETVPGLKTIQNVQAIVKEHFVND